MSIKSGSLSFRLFENPLPVSVGKFAERALPPQNTWGVSPVSGWTTSRHALDPAITEGTARYGGHLFLGFTMAEKKVPGSLLAAECKVEEAALLAASSQERLSAVQRSEIRRSVEDRLRAKVLHSIRTIEFVCPAPDKGTMVATCLSTSLQDTFVLNYTQAAGHALIPLSFLPAARDWAPISFTPGLDDVEADCEPGREFLTWLWHVAEACGGLLGDWAVMVEGPLSLASSGRGAHETVLRKGEPLLAVEAKSALLQGKKLKRAKITLARGDETYSFTLDDQLVVRSLKLPEAEKLDPVSRFQTRMQRLDCFCTVLVDLMRRFVEKRVSEEFGATMRQWVAERKGR
jgi:hypothetical protein